jgi:hypothetical protein
MRAKQYDGTITRWIWGELEILFPAGYLLGTLMAILYEGQTRLPIAITAPDPAPLPLTVYIDNEQMTLTASGDTYTVTRGVNGTAITTHNTFAEVRTDSYHPIARDYSLGHDSPIHFGSYALSCCEMTLNQLEAARQDSRLIVLPSVQSGAAIPDAVSTALASYGVTAGSAMNDMLTALSAIDSRFLPEA